MKNIIKRWIIAIIFGVGATYIFFPVLDEDLFKGRELTTLIFLIMLAFFSAATYFLVIRYFYPRFSILKQSVKILISVGGVLLASLVTTNLPIQYPTNSVNVDLSITATGSKYSKAFGSEVWLKEAYRSEKRLINIQDFHFGNGWELKDGIPVSYQAQPAVLSWSGKSDDDVKLTFISHPWSGEAEITLNGDTQTIDLYNPNGTSLSITIPVSGTEISKVEKNFFFALTSVYIGLLLLVTGFWTAEFIHKKGYFDKSNLEKYRNVNFFVKNAFVPLAFLSLYGFSFAIISSRLFSEGVNSDFASKLWKYILGLLIALCLVYSVGNKKKKEAAAKLGLKYSKENFSSQDFLLLLLPLTPVVQYIFSNQDILSPLESLKVLSFFALFSAIFVLGIPTFFGFLSSGRKLRILGLAFVFTITSMASLSANFSWYEYGDFKIQVLFLGGLWLLLSLLYTRKYRSTLYLFITATFIVTSIFQTLTNFNRNRANEAQVLEESRLPSLINQRKPVRNPNIYLLVYDSYVSNEIMQAYGLDNSAQENYLHDQGFKIYPHTYTVGGGTLESMGRVLNISSDYSGNLRRVVSGDGTVHNILKGLGYETYGIFPYDYMFRGIGSRYDYSFPNNFANTQGGHLISAIVIGEFRFDQGFNLTPHEQYIENKLSVFKELSGNRGFVYTHSSLPNHSQNSGSCLPNETTLYKERLASANLEMKQDIKVITENDPEAIIIVAGDHGPYLTKNCLSTSGIFAMSEISRLDIQDRYGSFLAIRWPTDDFEKYDDITVLQDLFPAVFAYLYEDASILETKIEPEKLYANSISGVNVKDGIIQGGINDGEPLFLSDE